jgi:hypothetical protein
MNDAWDDHDNTIDPIGSLIEFENLKVIEMDSDILIGH